MNYETELQRIVAAKESMRQSIIAKGVEVPESAKIEDYPTYIAQIVAGGGGYDPDNPTLEGLKAALDAGDKDAFPANSIIPDTYNGAAFNWVVGHYGTATMSDGSNKEGVYLFSSTSVTTMKSAYGSMQSIVAFYEALNGEIFTGCSDSLKSLVGEIMVSSSSSQTLAAKVWLMSAGEVWGVSPTIATGGGEPWDAWKIRTGLSSPSISDNAGRIMKTTEGDAVMYWTRSAPFSTAIYVVCARGEVRSASSYQTAGLIPCVFIPKGGNQ